MHRLALWFLLAGPAGLAGCASPPPDPPDYPPLALAAGDRIMVLAPHPDDEALACAGVIRQALALKLPVQVVFLTHGDNNELSFLLYRKYPVLFPEHVKAMGETRRAEALQAAAGLGLAPAQLVFLGYPDFGTLTIWLRHWQNQPAFQSMLTRATAVPYADAFRPGAPYRADEILADLTAQFRRFKPTRVFVSHPADLNPDHRALYLFTQVALWNLEKELRPRLEPYLVHYDDWPAPQGLHLDQPLLPPEGLADQVAWKSLPLGAPVILAKRQAIEAHRSQCTYAKNFMLAFVRSNELFGAFAAIPAGALAREAPRELEPAEAEQVPPEALTAEEKEQWTEILQRSLRLEHGELILTQRFSRPLLELVQAAVYCFGYRPDRPFAEMPKIRVVIGANQLECYDQTRKVENSGVTVARNRNLVTVRIPLRLLGDPQRILLSTTTYRNATPMDFISWRVVALRPTGNNGH